MWIGRRANEARSRTPLPAFIRRWIFADIIGVAPARGAFCVAREPSAGLRDRAAQRAHSALRLMAELDLLATIRRWMTVLAGGIIAYLWVAILASLQSRPTIRQSRCFDSARWQAALAA